MIFDATMMTVLVGLAAYRITRLITDDAILANWRERHGIGIDGYRCLDGEWYKEWPDDPHGCEHELSCEQAYQEAVKQAGERPWPLSWVSLLRKKIFWVRAFSCSQCGSVWMSGVLALLAVLAAAVTTGNWLWLLWWLAVAPAAAGIAARMMFD